MSDDRLLAARASAEGARKALRDNPKLEVVFGLCATLGALSEDEDLGVYLDGDDDISYGQAVGGFLPQIGDRVSCLRIPPSGLVVLGFAGTVKNNPPIEYVDTFGGASPTEALTAAAMTNWPVAGNTTVSVPPWSTRCVVQFQITGITPTSSFTVEYETRLAGVAGALRRQVYAANNQGMPMVGLDEFTVTPNSVLSAQLFAYRVAGAGALNYGAISDMAWSFRFYES